MLHFPHYWNTSNVTYLRSWPSDPEPVRSKNCPGASWVMVTSAKTLPLGVNMWLIFVMPTWKHTCHKRVWPFVFHNPWSYTENHSTFPAAAGCTFTLIFMQCSYFTLGIVLANRRSSSLWESFPFTMNFPKGVRSITPTFSITSLHSLPTGPNQLVRRKLGLNTDK